MKFLIPLLLLPFISFTQSHHQEIDVRSYALDISVNDSSNVIFGKNEVVVQFDKANAKELILDLVQPNDENKGMLVTSLRQDNKQVQFKQVNNQLIIELHTIPSNKKSTFDINYHGIPTDGLVISENKFGVRTFFGDNWPNRAHHWFPCIDHPSDKATVSFKVTHPDGYTCVANGKFISRIPLKTGMTLTTYKSEYELPTKVTVFGLAALVSDTLSHPTNLEHVNFVYPQNKDAGFKDMSVAKDPLLFFETNIAAYPFEKLFNVQSTTRYGGMENAGCIFYDENAVTGEQGMENLIAHEIAHQWFGNSASEADWSHLWLSEGFATYFTNLHLEQKYGRAKMNEQLIKDRNRVIRFRQMVELPLKDTLTDEPLKMLNPNAYQKGSWVLHMLRNKIGNEAFWNGIRAYYNQYQYSNARSIDFQKAMQGNTDVDLSNFFIEWLTQKGHPILKTELIEINGKQHLSITQTQDDLFSFPIEVQLNSKNGKRENTLVFIDEKEHLIELNFGFKVDNFDLDPKINLLFEKSK